MKYLFATLFALFFTWPALVLGYAWGAICVGFCVGRDVYEDHAAAAVEKFKKEKP